MIIAIVILLCFIILFFIFKKASNSKGLDERLNKIGKVEEKQKGVLTDKELFSRLFSYMKPYKLNYVIACLMMLISVVLDIIAPRLTGLSLAELGSDEIRVKYLLTIFICGIIANILSKVIGYFQTLLMHRTGHKIVMKIRGDVFRHIQSLSHNQFNSIPVGTLVTRNTSDIGVLFEMYTSIIVNVIKSVATIIGVFSAMMLLNVELSIIVLCISPLILTLTIIFRKVLRKVHREVRTKVSAMNAFLSENISGMKVTQVFNQENKKYNEFKEANDDVKKATIKQIFTFGIFRPSIFFIYLSTVIIILYTGGNKAITTNFGLLAVCISYADLYVFYQYISKFFNPIQSLADQYDQLQNAFAAAEKIFTVLDIVPDITDSEDAIEIEIEGNIEFKNVWFAYKDENWVLKDVSFNINAKDVVALVGATGAGKSTILGLITRNYDIQKGQILIDGVDIKHIKIESIRNQIGQMLQDVFLFSGNIAENVRLFNEEISDEEIINACKEVNAWHFISKNPLGIKAEVSERGNNLSQGEKQLISFARVLVHKPKLMILDEATSNIDTETEKLIQESLEKVISHNTMIMVAHRLSTIQHANKIIVFDHGRIIEQGNHQELLKLRGRYYNLYMLQYEKETLKNV